MDMPVLEVACSLIGWLSLYLLFCCTFPHRGAEWNCRLVTLTHGVLIVLLTAYVVFIDGPWPFTHAGTENTDLQVFSLAVCLGYFFFDLSWCVCYRTEGPVMMAHHTASILGILLALFTGVSGCETCGVIFGSEITNPLLQSRWFLRQLGLYEGLLGDAVDLLFILLFATVRVGVGTVMFYCELTSPRTLMIMKLGGVVMYLLAWVFMVDIARFGYKKSRAKYKQWMENHQLSGINTENLLQTKSH
ncbi:TLC domain-containing protein 5 [Nothobranchius furzeri]|uniref:TLC domain containing 5b n=1 Tax=Nothobranchius furzeri TaxID=105023 RepID=A0A1A8AF11_NOTFU|nr:TLC domain-containing protein 5 [Nothobranchius furzeri]KAF7206701.1 transcript variant X1 [Nothobranchius furzeri]KAF7206702.1 transcript variant X2 [Nothobranchius furzeri]